MTARHHRFEARRIFFRGLELFSCHALPSCSDATRWLDSELTRPAETPSIPGSRVSIPGATRRRRPRRRPDGPIERRTSTPNESGNRIIRERESGTPGSTGFSRRRPPQRSEEGRPHRSGREEPDPGTRARRQPSSPLLSPVPDRRSRCTPEARYRRQGRGNPSEDPASMLSARAAASTAPPFGLEPGGGDRNDRPVRNGAGLQERRTRPAAPSCSRDPRAPSGSPRRPRGCRG